MTERKRRKSRYKKQSRKVIAGIILVTGLLGGMTFYRTQVLKEKDDSYAAREADLQNQIESEEQKAADLEEEEIYIQTDQYIEEIARTKLGLVKPGEILLKPDSGE